MQVIHAHLVQELHKLAKEHQFERAVVGLSGGLDSAVVFCLALRAFGAKNITALLLPEIGITDPLDLDHARALAEFFAVPSHYQPINNFLVDFNFVSWEKSELGSENLKPRIRASLLRHFADSTNSLLLGTANKSDLLLGFGRPDGEFVGDLHILGDLFKTEVLDLAMFLNLPAELIDKMPTRGLKLNQTDEEDLGAPWHKIDEILSELHLSGDPESLIEKGMDSLLVHKLFRLMQQNEPLAKTLPIIPLGHIPDSILKACEAEAKSLS